MSVTEWLADATPDRAQVPVCFDRGLVSALRSAKEELRALRESAALGTKEQMLEPSEAEQAVRARIADLEGQVKAKTKVFVFEGLGWGGWRKLIGKHPPKREQAEVFQAAVELGFMPHAVENISYDAETFVPAAMSASCTEPGMTVEEARQLIETAPPGVLDRIWAGVLDANLAGHDDPFVEAAADGSAGVRPTAKK